VQLKKNLKRILSRRPITNSECTKVILVRHLILEQIAEGFHVSVKAHNVYWSAQITISHMRIQTVNVQQIVQSKASHRQSTQSHLCHQCHTSKWDSLILAK